MTHFKSNFGCRTFYQQFRCDCVISHSYELVLERLVSIPFAFDITRKRRGLAADLAFILPLLVDWSSFMNDILRYVHYNLSGFVVVGKGGFATTN